MGGVFAVGAAGAVGGEAQAGLAGGVEAGEEAVEGGEGVVEGRVED